MEIRFVDLAAKRMNEHVSGGLMSVLGELADAWNEIRTWAERYLRQYGCRADTRVLRRIADIGLKVEGLAEEVERLEVNCRDLIDEVQFEEEDWSCLTADTDMNCFESITWGVVDGEQQWVLHRLVRPGKYELVGLGQCVQYRQWNCG